MDTRSITPTTRRRGVAILAMLATMFLLTSCLSSGQERVLLEINKSRKAHNVRTLSIQNDAQRKAQAWAEKLARENRLYHSKLSSGISVRWCSLGENVGYGSSASDVHNSYMRSSGHRANILSSKWSGVGVGYAKNGNRVFTVQVFIKTC